MSRIKLRIAPPTGDCHYCPRPATCWDHIVPYVLGGVHYNYNLIPSCEHCNFEKAEAWPTCKCPKCTMAVAIFITDPDRLQFAIDMTERRGRIMKVKDARKLNTLLREMQASYETT